MSKRGKWWGDRETDLLVSLFEIGTPRKEIAKEIGRDTKSINTKLSRLGIINLKHSNYGKKPALNGSKKLNLIMQVVCDHFEVNENVFFNKSRRREFVEPRQLAHKLAKELTIFSLATIGSEIGRKGHATVLHSIKTIDNLIETDIVVKDTYKKLKKDYFLKNKKSNKHVSESSKLIKSIKAKLPDIDSKIMFNQLIKDINGKRTNY